jgi:glutathione peroxidase-family protein
VIGAELALFGIRMQVSLERYRGHVCIIVNVASK